MSMTPLEAASIDLEEPDWSERFEEHCKRWPSLPRYLAEDSAFEATLDDWRRFHGADAVVKGKIRRQLADPTKGMIALAQLHIFPPRSLIRDIPRDNKCFEEKHDAHEWLIISQRAWRIVAIADKVLLLDSFGESKQIELNKARWDHYIENAVDYLKSYPTV